MNTPVPASSNPKACRCQASGFSLVELLAVIAIISIMMTMGLVGIKNLATGKGTTAAAASVEAIFEEARLTASSKATTARVLVSVDPTHSGFLRQILVAFRPLDPNTNLPDTTKWELASRGYLMPEGVYYSRKYSSKLHPDGGAVLVEDISSFPQSTYRGKYAVYEFNSEGICTTPGASFIIASGAMPKTSGAEKEPRVTGSAKRDFAGFVVWRNGRTSAFRTAEHASIPASVEKF